MHREAMFTAYGPRIQQPQNGGRGGGKQPLTVNKGATSEVQTLTPSLKRLAFSLLSLIILCHCFGSAKVPGIRSELGSLTPGVDHCLEFEVSKAQAGTSSTFKSVVSLTCSLGGQFILLILTKDLLLRFDNLYFKILMLA